MSPRQTDVRDGLDPPLLRARFRSVCVVQYLCRKALIHLSTIFIYLLRRLLHGVRAPFAPVAAGGSLLGIGTARISDPYPSRH